MHPWAPASGLGRFPKLPDPWSYVLCPFQGDSACLELVIFSKEEEFLGFPSYFIRHRKVWQLFRTQPETDLKSCTCLQGLAAVPRAAGYAPQSSQEDQPASAPRVPAVVSGGRCLGGIEAYRTMWSLGTDCTGGEQLWGSVPLSLPIARRVDSIAGSSSSHWVARALPPTSALQARPGRRAQLPLGEMALLRKAFLFSSSRLLDPSRPKSDWWLGLFQCLRSGWEGDCQCPSGGVLPCSNTTKAHLSSIPSHK